jgi:hypothetical protein
MKAQDLVSILNEHPDWEVNFLTLKDDKTIAITDSIKVTKMDEPYNIFLLGV